MPNVCNLCIRLVWLCHHKMVTMLQKQHIHFFCRESNLRTSSGKFLRVQFCHPESSDFLGSGASAEDGAQIQMRYLLPELNMGNTCVPQKLKHLPKFSSLSQLCIDGDLRMKSAAPQECHRDKGASQDRRPVAHRKSTVLLERIVTICGHIADCNEHSVSIFFSQIDSETKARRKKVGELMCSWSESWSSKCGQL